MHFFLTELVLLLYGYDFVKLHSVTANFYFTSSHRLT